MQPRSDFNCPSLLSGPTFSAVDPFSGLAWNRDLTPEEEDTQRGALPGNPSAPERTDASAPEEMKTRLPWVVVEAQRFAEERHAEFEVWGVTGQDAKVLAFLWRLGDNLPGRGCVIAAQKIIAEWLGCVRQTVAKILNLLISKGLFAWVADGFYSYRDKLAREVRWVGLGEAEEPPAPASRWSRWRLFNSIRAYLRSPAGRPFLRRVMDGGGQGANVADEEGEPVQMDRCAEPCRRRSRRDSQT